MYYLIGILIVGYVAWYNKIERDNITYKDVCKSIVILLFWPIYITITAIVQLQRFDDDEPNIYSTISKILDKKIKGDKE